MNRIKDPFKMRIPGRINLIGEHVDYNGGIVMPFAVNKYIDIVVSPRKDTLIELNSVILSDSIGFDLRHIVKNTDKSWGNYALGVAACMKDEFPYLKGITATLSGNLKPASGLSSSAAFEVAFALALLRANNISMDPFSLAQLCQRAEHDYVGVNCGLMDQIAVIMGQKNKIIYFDTTKNNTEYISFPVGYIIAGIHSGETRELVGSVYNERRDECSEAFNILHKTTGVEKFSSVSLKQLLQTSPFMLSTLYKRALHVIQEMERTKKAAYALTCGDMELVGRLLNDSHESLSSLFETSLPTIDVQVEQIQALPGVLGSRLCGAGFGGYIIALVETSSQRRFLSGVNSLIKQSVLPGEFFLTRPQDGAIKYFN